MPIRRGAISGTVEAGQVEEGGGTGCDPGALVGGERSIAGAER